MKWRGASEFRFLPLLLITAGVTLGTLGGCSDSSTDDATRPDAATAVTPDGALSAPDAAPDAATDPLPDAAVDATMPPATVCGNGVVEGSEACDDGANMPGDGCDGECATEPGFACTGAPSVCAPVCGDMILAGSEACDDGGSDGGDGCSATCTVEPGYSCTGTPSVCGGLCGDAMVVGAEQCDDGNAVNGDCCSSTCSIEPGCETESNNASATADPVDTHFVDDVVTGFIAPVGDVDFYVLTLPAGASGYLLHLQTLDGPISSCASNHIDSDIRLDDANGAVLAENDDAGGNFCSIVDFGVAPGTYFIRVAAAAAAGSANRSFDYRLRITAGAIVCGDGTRAGNEGCDDGNTVDGDGCSSSCAVESYPELEPNDTPATASGPLATDHPAQGAITPVGDQDFFRIDLAQRSDLHLETTDLTGPGHCTGVDTLIRLYAADGTTELASDDDDGAGNCSLLGAGDAALHHLAPGTYYVSVEEFESNAAIPGYLLFYSLDAVCGDGVVTGDEECDGGATCTPDCERVPVCGDGFIDAPEQCDDGNVMNGDGCDAACQREQVCGNGFLEDPEECDDHNTASGDGCSAICTVEPGHVFEHEPDDTAGTATSVPAGSLAHASIDPAGDKDIFSFVVPSFADVTVETFDGAGPSTCGGGLDTLVELRGPDGVTVLATDDDDGPGSCSMIQASADPAARHLAPGTYYVMVKEFHANLVVPAYTVRVSFSALCGNGVVEGAEECDGGPTCTATCERVAVCGDGFIDDPEQCDDGNVANGDGCSSTCQREQQCGNGTLEAPEVCDDGNTVSGDGCDAACAVIEAGHAFEREPNNTPATASDDPGLRIHARINPVGDRDYYRIKLSAPASLRIETFDNASPTTNTCSAIDTIIKLFAADGTTQLALDDDDGPGNCSKIDPASDAGAMNLAAGVYYLVVDEYNDDALVPGYQVVITTL